MSIETQAKFILYRENGEKLRYTVPLRALQHSCLEKAVERNDIELVNYILNKETFPYAVFVDDAKV